MDELEELLKGIPPLVASLQAVREEDSRHSQYVTAMDSLKHIFTVPESVAKTKQWIGEGKLLHAHQVLKFLTELFIFYTIYNFHKSVLNLQKYKILHYILFGVYMTIAWR